MRQRLQPYLYTLFGEAHRTGAPILRPLLFEYPDDTTTYTCDDEFLLGSALLVAPVARPGLEYRHVYLPAGTWVHIWSGERHVGPAHVLIRAPLGQPGVFARANTPIPTREGDALTWQVYTAHGPAGAADVYLDAGDGYAFLEGQWMRMRAMCRVTGASVDLSFELEGDAGFAPRSLVLDVRGVTRPTRVVVDEVESQDWEHANERLIVRTGQPRRVSIAAAPTMDAV